MRDLKVTYEDEQGRHISWYSGTHLKIVDGLDITYKELKNTDDELFQSMLKVFDVIKTLKVKK